MRNRASPRQLSALRELFVRADDPYAGADMPTVRNAMAVLLALHAALALVFLTLVPPTAIVGAPGWIVGGAVVMGSVGGAVWLASVRARVTFGRLLLLSYLGLAAPVLLQLLSASSVPYQLLFLVWVGCGGVQPARRAAAYLGVLAVAAPLPALLLGDAGEIWAALAWSVLFTVVGLILTAYVSFVRAQRIELRGGERDARALAKAASKRVRDLQWVTDAAVSHLPLETLLDVLLERIAAALEVDGGEVLLRNGSRPLVPAASRGVVG